MNVPDAPLDILATPEDSAFPARHWHRLEDGRIQCDVCPRDCKLADGQRGLCFVRRRVGDALHLTTYGRSSGFCVDPVEKKPLNHFHPGSSVLSFGTAGCNLTCKFCQNWDISKSREMDRLADQASPEAIARAAERAGCRSVAYTYNDPTIFLEYATDVADACHAIGVESIAVTAGYIHDAARRDLYAKMDAANVDLKAFREDFYWKVCGGHLEAVKDTLKYLRTETRVWLEITTLLIPGQNDSDAEVTDECEWIAEALGLDVPLHFSAFHPDYKMTDIERTPAKTLTRARAIAKKVGLHHVYTGNVHDREGDTTTCTGCGATLIVRDWYVILEDRVDERGLCPDCATPLAGRFGGKKPGAVGFGRRRIPIAVGARPR